MPVYFWGSIAGTATHCLQSGFFPASTRDLQNSPAYLSD
jgi:hypothetical protein